MDDSSVKVAVRIRPQSVREKLDLCQICTHVVAGEPQVNLGADKSFTFDHVFDIDTLQQLIYEGCCAKLIEGTFEGYNATILAYGQTGSGKTYTMGMGFDLNSQLDQYGIIPRAVQHLFNGIEERRQQAIQHNQPPPDFKVMAQFMELYNEEINDLLDSTRDASEKCRKSHIRIHEDACGDIYIVGVTAKPVYSLQDTMDCLKMGALLRTTGSTNMNLQSSRSHAIFTLHIKQQRIAKTSAANDDEYISTMSTTDLEILSAKFHFVDLAGSERLKRTGATGDRAKEGISINCGLLALGNVISALGDKMKRGSHVPYRDSKLTRLLQDSLGGNSRTLMIACISPCDRDLIETMSTLKYANRARNIRNKVSINQDKCSKQLSSLKAEIAALKQELMEFKSGRKPLEIESPSTSSLHSSDITLENHLLTKEIESLRLRVKILQETIESLTMRIMQLTAEKNGCDVVGNNDEGGASGVSNAEKQRISTEKYVIENERLRCNIMQLKATVDVLKRSVHQTTPSRILQSPSEMNFNLSPDDHVKHLLNIAQRDVANLQNQMKLKTCSETADDGNLNEDNDESNKIIALLDDSDVNNDDGDDDDDDDDDEGEEDNEDNGNNGDDSSDVEVGNQDSHGEKLNQTLADLTCEISIKEKLIEELRLAQMRFKKMKTQYEDKMKLLEARIHETQLERDRVLANLEHIESNSVEKTNKVRDDYEKKLAEMQTELKKLNQANQEHSKLVRSQVTFEKQFQTLQNDLLEMKKIKVQLMTKMKEDALKMRQSEQSKDKEINQLKKGHRMKDNQIKSLEAENKQKEIILRRKQEEVEMLRKRQRPTMSSRASGQIGRSDNNSTVSVNLTNFSRESTRPRKPTKFNNVVSVSNKSAKTLWNDINKLILDIVSKKQTLSHMEKDMNRWMKQREHLGHKLSKLLKRCNREEFNKDLTSKIECVKNNLTFVQENIKECQSNIMQMEETKDMEDCDPIKLVRNCSLGQCRCLLESAIQSIIMKEQMLSEQGALNRELEAKLHQQKMDSTYQRGMLQYFIEAEDDIDSSLIYRASDNSDSENDSVVSIDRIFEKSLDKNECVSRLSSSVSLAPSNQLNVTTIKIISSTPTSLPTTTVVTSLSSKDSTTVDLNDITNNTNINSVIIKKDKARRRTATPDELLFICKTTQLSNQTTTNNSANQSDSSNNSGAMNNNNNNANLSAAHNNKNNINDNILMPPPRFIPRPYSKINHSNPRQNNKPQPVAPDPSLRKKLLSASLSVGSAVLSKCGSNDSADVVTPPLSPPTHKRHQHSNVFSRLTRKTQPVSPHPTKGVISTLPQKQSTTFPLLLCNSAQGHTKAVLAVHATDDFLFTGSKDRTTKIWDLQTSEEVLTLGAHLNNVVSVKYNEYTNVVYTASTYLVKLWDPRQGNVCIKTLTSAGFLSDNQSTSSVSSSSSTNDAVTRQVTCPPGEINIVDICINSSGNVLYSAAGNIVRVWDMRMYKTVGKLSGGHQAAVMTMAIDDTDTADGNICVVTGSKDHYIKIYELMEDSTGVITPKYNLEPPHYDGIQSLCLMGDLLFSGSRDMCIKKWDLADQQLVQSVNNAHKDWVCGLSLLPSANCLLSACRAGIMKVWNVDNCHLLGELQAHNDHINAICSNSQMIFSASNDKTVHFWKSKSNLDFNNLLDSY